MKKTILLLITSFYLSGVSFAVQGKALLEEINSFSQVPALVNKIGDPMSTLIVMDDDDTLTMMQCDVDNPLKNCQYLGGPAWYSWQHALLQNYLHKTNDSPYRVADTQQQLDDIASLLLFINNMEYTETAIPTVLANMTQKGVRLMVETARGNGDVAATHNQLSNLNAGEISFSSLIENNAPIFEQAKIPSLASPFSACNLSGYEDVTYQQGVTYVSGQNKGILLKCLLSQYNEEATKSGLSMPIKHVIFIDDTLENVIDMRDSFVNEENYDVYALHYTALEAHKNALTKGENKGKFQELSNKRWHAIKFSLQANLLQPNLGGE